MELKISEATAALLEHKRAEAASIRKRLELCETAANDILNVAFFEAFIDPNKVTNLQMNANILTFDYEEAIQENESREDTDQSDS